MEVQIAVSGSRDGHAFDLWVEPEGMVYEFPGADKVLLSFRGPDAMMVELSHRDDAIVIWRPADTEVWATLPDGSCDQIGGWRHIPVPGLDSGGAATNLPAREAIETFFHQR